MEEQPPSEKEVLVPTEALNFKLASNPLLEKLSFVFAISQLDSETLTDQITRLGGYLGDKHKKAAQVPGALAEAHVDRVLAKFAIENPEAKIDVIPDDSATENYKFVRGSTGNLKAIEKNSLGQIPKDIAEYDQVVVIDGLPVIIEVKSSSRNVHSGEHQDTKRLNNKLAPLKEFFGTDTFGYVIVSPQDRNMVRLRQPFRANTRGILLPKFPFSREELKAQADEIHTRIMQKKSEQKS